MTAPAKPPVPGDAPDQAVRCPECEQPIERVWRLPHPLLVHWVLNPGLAFNELLLGQRLPAVMHVCQRCPGLPNERTYVQCPGCRAVHSSMIWSHGNAFGHWLGLVCPDCGGRIPCLWNVTSLLVLWLTMPLWWLPLQAGRERLLEHSRKLAREARARRQTRAPVPVHWTKVGVLGLGGVAWLVLTLAATLSGKASLPLVAALLPVFLLLGWVWGRSMKWLTSRRRAPEREPAPPTLHVQRLTTRGQCPYCHTAVEDAESVACTGCVARHHMACWDEHGACAACGARARFTGIEETRGAEAPAARPGADKARAGGA